MAIPPLLTKPPETPQIHYGFWSDLAKTACLNLKKHLFFAVFCTVLTTALQGKSGQLQRKWDPENGYFRGEQKSTFLEVTLPGELRFREFRRGDRKRAKRTEAVSGFGVIFWPKSVLGNPT